MEVVKTAEIVETKPKGRRGKKAAAEEGMRETGGVEEKPAAEEAKEEDSQKPAAEVHEQVVTVSPVK